jgi:hypothetical protein
MLAAAYWRLGRGAEAAAAASDALAFHPQVPEAYRQISYAFATGNRFDDAAIALIAGGMITSDFSLGADLVGLYRSAFSNSCALTAGPNGPAVNPACDLVRKHFCAASLEVVKASMDAQNWDLAKQQKKDFEQKYGCPAGPLDQVLPE